MRSCLYVARSVTSEMLSHSSSHMSQEITGQVLLPLFTTKTYNNSSNLCGTVEFCHASQKFSLHFITA